MFTRTGAHAPSAEQSGQSREAFHDSFRYRVTIGVKLLRMKPGKCSRHPGFAAVKCATILVSVSDLERQIRAELRR